MSTPAQVIFNGVSFSKYELEVSCAIKLWIKNANNAVPSDETLGYIINSLRGKVNGTALPCANLVPQIQRHSQEGVRSIYMSVYVNKSYWGREASRVYYAWLKQNDNIVKRLVPQVHLSFMNRGSKANAVARLKATGALAPFLNPDGTLRTQPS